MSKILPIAIGVGSIVLITVFSSAIVLLQAPEKGEPKIIE